MAILDSVLKMNNVLSVIPFMELIDIIGSPSLQSAVSELNVYTQDWKI